MRGSWRSFECFRRLFELRPERLGLEMIVGFVRLRRGWAGDLCGLNRRTWATS